ncbi:DNA repair protein RecN [Alteromonas sediminis]|uniref:DNA repair protein RecN n=1 Tax=Alteromonas sediminis TaxID=2259342 RepID=A0A3N5Y1P5_9ALTE|nr:DNA repair protein RecN [Alteromonas sediminis]RPJ67120.1 DNA repair protein RecN [Alteromonas sediminis]
MLIHLSIKNFAVVKQLELNFEQGLTAITGETGAGKSIAIDALSLCLGERADASCVRKGAAKSEIIAHFSLNNNHAAKAWLSENELDADDESEVCFIRRVISSEGRSKAFINGTTASLNQLKALGSLLLLIYGQNTHLKLLKESEQLRLLDDYAGHSQLLNDLENAFKLWKSKEKVLEETRNTHQLNKDREQLLAYQVKELDDFAIEEDEFSALEDDHKKLSHSQHLLDVSQQSLYSLYESDDGSVLSTLKQYKDRLNGLTEHDKALAPIVQMLDESSIQIEEAVRELRHYVDNLESDPAQLAQVERRFSCAVELARKHQVRPESLYEHHQSLAAELSQITGSDERLEQLAVEVDNAKQDYISLAKQVSANRTKQGKALAKAIMQYVHQMNMESAEIAFQVNFDTQKTATKQGLDSVALVASTNKGQAFGKLEKVVSGGELSRIGLAVQVVSRATNPVPSMIFDEVDAGISGPTASVVGQLLRKLGKAHQVMCVTHLPQVAAQAHNQLYVTKHTEKNETTTSVLPLTPQDRVHELARLLAGDKVTQSAIDNAKALLEQVV